MINGVMSKVQLAELMPAVNAARAQAMLALAAGKAGRPDLSDWLRRRAELLGDAPALKKERPILAELWPARIDVVHGCTARSEAPPAASRPTVHLR